MDNGNSMLPTGANQMNSNQVTNAAAVGAAASVGPLVGAGWPADTQAAAEEISAAISTAPIPTLPNSTRAVWSKVSIFCTEYDCF